LLGLVSDVRYTRDKYYERVNKEGFYGQKFLPSFFYPDTIEEKGMGRKKVLLDHHLYHH